MRLLIAIPSVLVLFIFLLGCIPKAEKGISDEELFGTDQGISDEELFGPETAGTTATGGAVSFGNLEGNEALVCKTASVGSCTEDANGIIHITNGNKVDTRVVSCNGDGSTGFHYQCLNTVTIQRCGAVCAPGEQCAEG